MGTTNYTSTFIRVAEDCPVEVAEVPLAKSGKPTIASLQYQKLAEHPYQMTSDDLLFAVYAERQAIPPEERDEARAAFFAKPQACLRSSPLGKRYGWGIHHDAEDRIALVPLGSESYRKLASDDTLRQVRAMRSKRASSN